MNYEEKYKKLLDYVKVVRHMQKEYFKTRNKDVLKTCKNYEKELDELIEQESKPVDTQQKLV